MESQRGGLHFWRRIGISRPRAPVGSSCAVSSPSKRVHSLSTQCGVSTATVRRACSTASDMFAMELRPGSNSVSSTSTRNPPSRKAFTRTADTHALSLWL
ncbi:MAG TPA: hypothetical protein VFV49_10880 [Thermoanaerobaculia bacterium]|nr:hypothetical protein [Thermoanaerobaculia bacterium]